MHILLHRQQVLLSEMPTKSGKCLLLRFLQKLKKFLNDKQLEAVAKAVSAPDIAIIQGPPGTGKTTVIAEIIWQQILKET